MWGRQFPCHSAPVRQCKAKKPAKFDPMSWEEIQSLQATLLHRTRFWAWWDNGKLTNAFDLPDEMRAASLPAAAEHLITKALWSHSSRPTCGWVKLTRVAQIVEQTTLAVGLRGETGRSDILERLIIQDCNGEEGYLYLFQRGFKLEGREAYLYEISTFFPMARFLTTGEISNVTLDTRRVTLQSSNGLMLEFSGIEAAALNQYFQSFEHFHGLATWRHSA